MKIFMMELSAMQKIWGKNKIIVSGFQKKVFGNNFLTLAPYGMLSALEIHRLWMAGKYLYYSLTTL